MFVPWPACTTSNHGSRAFGRRNWNWPTCATCSSCRAMRRACGAKWRRSTKTSRSSRSACALGRVPMLTACCSIGRITAGVSPGRCAWRSKWTWQAPERSPHWGRTCRSRQLKSCSTKSHPEPRRKLRRLTRRRSTSRPRSAGACSSWSCWAACSSSAA